MKINFKEKPTWNSVLVFCPFTSVSVKENVWWRYWKFGDYNMCTVMLK